MTEAPILRNGQLIPADAAWEAQREADRQAWENTPPEPYNLPKSVFWSRTTEAEAEAVEAGLEQASAKDRRLFTDAVTLRSQDEAFARFRDQLAAAFGESRADELVARPTDEEMA